jgi:hypothetical protein
MSDYTELLSALEPSPATNIAYTLHAELKHAEAMCEWLAMNCHHMGPHGYGTLPNAEAWLQAASQAVCGK